MLLAGLSQHIRFDVTRTLKSNGDRQQINVHGIVVGNLGRKGKGEIQTILLKWTVEELLLSSGPTKSNV
jgi:hypothetical protein